MTELEIRAMSIFLSLLVFARRIRCTRLGIVMARGAHSKAPTSARNLSILSATVSAIVTERTTTIALCKF